MLHRPAGLGILFVNVQVQPTQTIYIQAKLAACSSVLMAEAASLALAAVIADQMNLRNITFLSDSQQLVHFLNQQNQAHPPDWRIKPFTQRFSNHANNRESTIYKINRQLNITADALARQALASFASGQADSNFNCSYEHHVSQCSFLQVIQHVNLNGVIIHAARCC
jgi:ribonuclease HI